MAQTSHTSANGLADRPTPLTHIEINKIYAAAAMARRQPVLEAEREQQRIQQSLQPRMEF